MRLIRFDRSAVAAGGDLEAADRPAGEQADDTATIATMNPPSDQPKMVTMHMLLARGSSRPT